MASLAQMLVQRAATPLDHKVVSVDIAGGMAQGAQIALQKEQLEQNKLKLEQKKKDVQNQKLEKFVEAYQKGANYKGQAKSKYYKQVLPRYRDSMGLTEMFPDETLEFMTSDPSAQARVESVIAKVRQGQMSEEDGLSILRDPVTLAGIEPEYQESAYKALTEASNENLKTKRTETMANAQMDRQLQQQAAAPHVATATKIGTDFSKFEASGGTKAAKLSIAKLDKAIELLGGVKGKPAKVKTGTSKILAATSMPLVGGDTALAKLAPEVKEVQDMIHDGVNMKTKLDSSFSDAAAKLVLGRTFDPNLPNAANLEKLKALRAERQAELDTKLSQFKQHGFMGGDAQGKAKAPGTDKVPPLTEDRVSQIKQTLSKLPEEKQMELIKALSKQSGIDEKELKKQLGIK